MHWLVLLLSLYEHHQWLHVARTTRIYELKMWSCNANRVEVVYIKLQSVHNAHEHTGTKRAHRSVECI